MEEQVVQLLAQAQSTRQGPRKTAETQLVALWPHPDYAPGLVAVASHDSVDPTVRQAALLALKQFVVSCWSPQFAEFKGQPGDVLVQDHTKARVRGPLLALVVADGTDRRLKAAASYAVGKIAAADFPEQWPDLLQTLMRVIPAGTDSQLHGALRVLSDLVEDSFGEDQFFAVANDLVQLLYDVAASDQRRTTLRAFAVSVFRGCFNILETVMGEHKQEVKAFAAEMLRSWLPFFMQVMQSRLPATPSQQDEDDDTAGAEAYRGLVALKLQVVKALLQIRTVFPALLAPTSVELFQATWEELTSLQPAYHQIYIEEERQSRLEDADGLPYTLDFLVLEELDFMQACLRAGTLKAQLDNELAGATSIEGTWVTEFMKLAVAYAQITTEEEGLWDIDVNIFLSEETSVTANYTPRTACGDLVIKIGEWKTQETVDGLLAYTRTLFSTAQSWKAKEAALYILNQLLIDFQDVDKQIGPPTANGFIDFIRHAMQQPDDFLRARGHLVAAALARTTTVALPFAPGLLDACLQTITNDRSDVVQVSCIRALQFYIAALPTHITVPQQNEIVAAISTYLQAQDLQELAESDDLTVTLVETLRDAIMLDTRICITGTGLDLLFQVASHGANNFQLVMLVNETFEDVTSNIASLGGDAYFNLCAKVLPSLNAALDIGNLTEENSLTNLAADLLSLLAEHGPEPLPAGFVQATMPKLTRILLASSDDELLKSATTAVKNITAHGHQQLFAWQSEDGKSGLEVVLIIIDRLLSPNVTDNAAAEVGALAAEVVEKAGSERLGPYLPQLLRAVAVRLGSATHAAFIQSLTLVFARLSLGNASEVVNFLAGLDIDGVNGLQVVLAKWLENSINFAGYDEIRQNVIALSKLYDLKDPRIAQIMVRGDLIVTQDGRIMTRSRARQTPDQYTIVTAPLKILKVLIVELQSASGANRELDAAADIASEDSNEEWEDDDPFLELTGGLTKNQLMAYAADDAPEGRRADDETQHFLVDFFKRAATTPGFKDEWDALSEAEQKRLQESAQ